MLFGPNLDIDNIYTTFNISHYEKKILKQANLGGTNFGRFADEHAKGTQNTKVPAAEKTSNQGSGKDDKTSSESSEVYYEKDIVVIEEFIRDLKMFTKKILGLMNSWDKLESLKSHPDLTEKEVIVYISQSRFEKLVQAEESFEDGSLGENEYSALIVKLIRETIKDHPKEEEDILKNYPLGIIYSHHKSRMNEPTKAKMKKSILYLYQTRKGMFDAFAEGMALSSSTSTSKKDQNSDTPVKTSKPSEVKQSKSDSPTADQSKINTESAKPSDYTKADSREKQMLTMAQFMLELNIVVQRIESIRQSLISMTSSPTKNAKSIDTSIIWYMTSTDIESIVDRYSMYVNDKIDDIEYVDYVMTVIDNVDKYDQLDDNVVMQKYPFGVVFSKFERFMDDPSRKKFRDIILNHYRNHDLIINQLEDILIESLQGIAGGENLFGSISKEDLNKLVNNMVMNREKLLHSGRSQSQTTRDQSTSKGKDISRTRDVTKEELKRVASRLPGLPIGILILNSGYEEDLEETLALINSNPHLRAAVINMIRD